MRRLCVGLLVLLSACGSPGGGGGNGSFAEPPAYIEAGLLIYDSQVLVPSAALPAPLRADLQTAQRRARLEPQSLPLGYQVLLKAFWPSAPEAEGYRVYLREEGGEAQEIASLGSGETELTLTDLLPQIELEEGRSYEAGVASVVAGRAGAVVWSWPLRALGAVHLSAPAAGSSQPSRPNFMWVNARGNPVAAELAVADESDRMVLSGVWTGTPLLSSATASLDLPAGSYRWTVLNATSSHSAQDRRTRQYFPSGYMVLSLPAALPFTVGSSGGGGGGGGSGDAITVLSPADFAGGQAAVTLENLGNDESVALIPVYATQATNPDGFDFSLTVQGVSGLDAAPPATEALSLLEQGQLEHARRHREVLARSQAAVEDLLARGARPLGTDDSLRSQAFDKCPPPYPAGKQCQFWVGAFGPAEQVTTTLRFESQNAYWFVQNEDLSDFSDSELQALAQQFEATTVPTDTGYFGDFPDVDRNGKIFIVFSRILGESLLGYVAPWDYFPDSQTCPDPNNTNTCLRSNEGDIFYATTPGASQAFYPREDFFGVIMPATITHELKHLIASGNRLLAGNAPEELWSEEASAVAAQQLAGQGTQVGLTYNFAQQSLARPQDFRVVYQGRPGSQEENFSIYGYNFLLMWRIAEKLGHEQFWKAWTAGPGVGVANLEAHARQPLEELMLDWALTLLFDNSNLLEGYDYESLNLRDGNWQALGYQPLASTQGRARSMAYYVGRGTGGDASVQIQTTHPEPYVLVVRFKGVLPY